ncbi:tRNA(Met) cytidine acetyltransferase TmcA [Psychromonas marina]|uniref:tRNA(Met) cytidine acetyltransferase TmcA n=1 Tax=Psychromonas marina TaxID=88364 RepID=A0ABQ6DZE0_9GAMM|nr:GNAT family N-acetyltransferase [Psychromonas marina]GLS90513.1 tRNA(Met) cytidine acetyltransferase TmcA [Psychromonas marina]
MKINTHSNHRQLIRLQGSLDWCYQQCEQYIANTALPYFWLGDAPEKIFSTLYKQILGQETSLLIINAHQQFDPNLFAASEGTLRGGGTLILISPSEISNKDHFYTYIYKQLIKADFLTISEGSNTPIPLLTNSCAPRLQLDQQKTAIEAITKTVTGHRRRPLVLTANRGRGKSAALGIAAKQLIESGIQKILVCAPSKAATNTLFKHAGISVHIEFIAPDLLLDEKPSCDLLMVDEAAALPVPLLEALTIHYSRIVFATTLHGYEGSGRGFALRFQKRLKEIAPQSRAMHLDQPIRWDRNDPVEQFTLQNLCLTETQTDSPVYDKLHDTKFELITTQQLLANHSLLTEIFSLLVIAHYQTKPSDLEKLLNDATLSTLVLTQHKRILAVALVCAEGEIEQQLAEQIYQGKRRINGHLVAQSFTFHCAQPQAATHKYARIQRIAIHPAIQQQGLGKHFIDKLTYWAGSQQFDHLCASFGASAELLKFWQAKQFQTLRIGSSKDKSSGVHSFIVNLPLSDKGKALHLLLKQQFHDQLLVQLSRHLQQIDSELVFSLISELSKTSYQHPLLTSYCSGHLLYEFAEFHLINLIINSDLSLLAKSQQRLTIQKILQNRSWAEVCQNGEYTGKKQAQQTLRISIKQLLTSTNQIEE